MGVLWVALVIAAVLQSQQLVLTHSRAFAQLPPLDIGLAYQGHWVRIDLVIKPPLPPFQVQDEILAIMSEMLLLRFAASSPLVCLRCGSFYFLSGSPSV